MISNYLHRHAASFRGAFLSSVGLLYLFSVPSLASTSITRSEGDALGVSLSNRAGKLSLQWSSTAPGPAHAIPHRQFQVWQSADLQTWEPVGPLVDLPGIGLPFLEQEVSKVSAKGGYWKIETREEPLYLASDGADAIGLNQSFQQNLAQWWTQTPAGLAADFPAPGAQVEQISFDPTSGLYWDAFSQDPAVHNASLPAVSLDRRMTDYRLNERELALFRKNGFVVSDRLGGHSCTDVFYKLWTDDLPVYVSSDAVLQAWHRTFVRMLEEVELAALRPSLATLLQGMRARLLQLKDGTSEHPVIRQALIDADLHLSIAETLLNPTSPGPSFPSNQSDFSAHLAAALRAAPASEVEIFGSLRLLDYSQCRPRGHYDQSSALSSYFRAMQWLAQVDFRMLGGRPEKGSIRQLAASMAITLLMHESGQTATWHGMNDVLSALVGPVDSAVAPQLFNLLQAAELDSFAAWMEQPDLSLFAQQLASGQVGVGQIPGNLVWAPMQGNGIVFPRSFTVMGQRFVLDSWIISLCVFDRIWQDNPAWTPGGPEKKHRQVLRRLPSCLDVAFTVFGNNQPSELIAQRMQRRDGVAFRDGYNYSHQLRALRDTIDSFGSHGWQGSLYQRWLGALRELSPPIHSLTSHPMPEVFSTKAWAWSQLNSQLASWTHLRHDTVLYAKATYTPPTTCEYPTGYVEPRPSFWSAMKSITEATREALARLPVSGQVEFYSDVFGYETLIKVMDRRELQTRWLSHLDHFSSCVTTLRDIAQAELQQQPLSAAHLSFIRSLVHDEAVLYSTRTGTPERTTRSTAGPSVYRERRYVGWYPRLYYESVTDDSSGLGGVGAHPSDRWDALVTDVHTDAPDKLTGDPGATLHEGVGRVRLMMLCLNQGSNRTVYAGPVLSHYEFTKPAYFRMTDTEWKQHFTIPGLSATLPTPADPEWVASFAVPGQ